MKRRRKETKRQVAKRVFVQLHNTFKVWKVWNEKIIHKPTNKGQSMKNRTGVVLQEILQKIKLMGKKTKIGYIDSTTSTHGDTNTLSISAMTKTEKQIIQQEIQLRDLSLKPPQF